MGHKGIERRVEIYVGKVFEILLIGACHGINREIAVGHGVEEGIHRAFHQLHKGVFEGIFLRAAEHRMFDDVGNALVIFGGSGEGDSDRPVVVVGRHHDHPRTRLVVGVNFHFAFEVSYKAALRKGVIGMIF